VHVSSLQAHFSAGAFFRIPRMDTHLPGRTERMLPLFDVIGMKLTMALAGVESWRTESAWHVRRLA
jgi:hypothetical protein